MLPRPTVRWPRSPCATASRSWPAPTSATSGGCKSAAPPTTLPVLVHLSSLVERHSRASSFEKAEVELEHDQRDLRHRIAWLSGRRLGGVAPTAQIRRWQQRRGR